MMKLADIIHLSWKVYVTKLKKYLPLLAIAFLLSIIGNIVNYILIDVLQLVSKYAVAISILTSLLVSVLGIFISIMLVLYNDRALSNKKIIFNFKEVLPLFWPVLWMTFVVGVITFLGFVFFIVPGILFTVWYAFTLFIIVLEKKTGFKEVLAKSKNFSAGRFWPVLWRITVPNLFWALISYLVVAGLLNILGLITKISITQPDPANTGIGIATILITTLVSTFFLPLYLLVGNIVYNEVKK